MQLLTHCKKLLGRLQSAGSQLSDEVLYRYHRHFRGVDIDGPPIYIIGCGHSGTSLLLSILDAHSRLYSVPGESYLAFKDREVQHALLDEFERSTITAGKQRWVEKTPTHVRKIDELLRLTPDAHFLVMLRDGRDVACSIRDRTGDFEQGVERWVSDNREAEKYLSDPQFHRVKYEDIVREFGNTIGNVLNYCGEKLEKGIYKYHEKDKYFFSDKIEKPNSIQNNDEHNQYRNWQINKPIFDGTGRYKKEMNSHEKKIFKEKAGKELLKYGYEENNEW
jgi:hypothetical protein